jgi:hypothetical protein
MPDMRQQPLVRQTLLDRQAPEFDDRRRYSVKRTIAAADYISAADS